MSILSFSRIVNLASQTAARSPRSNLAHSSRSSHISSDPNTLSKYPPVTRAFMITSRDISVFVPATPIKSTTRLVESLTQCDFASAVTPSRSRSVR